MGAEATPRHPNSDGVAPVLVGTYLEYSGVPRDRFTKTPLRLFAGETDGSLRYAPELVEGTIDMRNPVAVADDFNGDARTDLAVFDAGVPRNGDGPRCWLRW